jgi:dimethylargininase
LTELGCQVRSLPPEPDLPDSVFVEDVAIVLNEVAVITRPGAESRRPESVSIAKVLRTFRQTVSIEAPCTLDGGDVLRLGRQLYVGRSGRSNGSGIEQLLEAVKPYNYGVIAVDVDGCLHLKSAVTQVAENTLLINRAWVDPTVFGTVELIDVDPTEPFAANALLIGETLIFPTAYPRTLARLEERGIRVKCVEVSELAKAEGGVTCCSLIFEHGIKGIEDG